MAINYKSNKHFYVIGCCGSVIGTTDSCSKRPAVCLSIVAKLDNEHFCCLCFLDYFIPLYVVWKRVKVLQYTNNIIIFNCYINNDKLSSHNKKIMLNIKVFLTKNWKLSASRVRFSLYLCCQEIFQQVLLGVGIAVCLFLLDFIRNFLTGESFFLSCSKFAY
jgi:hypothetical protein